MNRLAHSEKSHNYRVGALFAWNGSNVTVILLHAFKFSALISLARALTMPADLVKLPLNGIDIFTGKSLAVFPLDKNNSGP